MAKEKTKVGRTTRAKAGTFEVRDTASPPPLLFGPVPRIESAFSTSSRVIFHEGDALTFLRTLPSKVVRLVVTSPPYNIGKEYEKAKTLDEYLSEQARVIDELVRTLADDGSICWEVGNYVDRGAVVPLDILFYPLFKEHGLTLRNRIVWRFGHGLHASRRFSGRYETILWFTKGDRYVFNLDAVRVASKYPGKTYYKGPKRGQPSGNPMGKNPSDVWEVVSSDWENEWWEIPNVKANHPEKTVHPCQFPVELVERCVLALTNPGDWVLDPYAGVGSALVAALLHDRRTMGCDIGQAYVRVGRQRIHDLYRGRLKTRPLGQPIYQPSGREKVARRPSQAPTLAMDGRG
jgi:adenine-specific DNA-methyltransferase